MQCLQKGMPPWEIQVMGLRYVSMFHLKLTGKDGSEHFSQCLRHLHSQQLTLPGCEQDDRYSIWAMKLCYFHLFCGRVWWQLGWGWCLCYQSLFLPTGCKAHYLSLKFHLALLPASCWPLLSGKCWTLAQEIGQLYPWMGLSDILPLNLVC